MAEDIVPEYSDRGKVIVNRDNHEGMHVGGISFFSCMGNQGTEVPNNVVVMRIGDWVVAQNGDNAMDEAEEFLSNHRIDLVITSSWNNFRRTMRFIKANPENSSCVYIPGHENEWQHSVDHRESYWELFTRKDRFADAEFDYLYSVIMDAAGDTYTFPAK